jgi:hypothetical protein
LNKTLGFNSNPYAILTHSVSCYARWRHIENFASNICFFKWKKLPRVLDEAVMAVDI